MDESPLATRAARFGWALVLIALCAGCATVGSAEPPSATAGPPQTLPLTNTQRAWWAEHKHLAKQVPGQGYQVVGYPGFYTAEGARIVPATAVIRRDATDEDENEDLVPSPAELYNRGRRLVGVGPDEQAARKALEEGQVLYRERKFEEAAEKFNEAADRWPDSPLAEDAMFLAGECAFFTDDYPDARELYETVLTKYPNSRYLDTTVQRLFAIAQYWEKLQGEEPRGLFRPNFTDPRRPKLNAEDEALLIYRQVYLNHAAGPLADDAIMAIATANFRNRNWERADYHYSLVRNEYPTSKHQFDAHLLGLQSKFNLYQGPLYEKKNLDDCGKLAERLLKQFPSELQGRNERARIEKMHAGDSGSAGATRMGDG